MNRVYRNKRNIGDSAYEWIWLLIVAAVTLGVVSAVNAISIVPVA